MLIQSRYSDGQSEIVNYFPSRGREGVKLQEPSGSSQWTVESQSQSGQPDYSSENSRCFGGFLFVSIGLKGAQYSKNLMRSHSS